MPALFPGQFKLVAHGLAVKVLEIIGVHLDYIRASRFRQRANWLGCRRRRRTRWCVVPEAAVLEDFADHVVLAGFDVGNSFHRAAALRA